MKTVNKKELHELFVSYDEWFNKYLAKRKYERLWKKTYSMASSIEKNIDNRLSGSLYNIIYNSKHLNENVTFEQIVKCLEAIGFEVK